MQKLFDLHEWKGYKPETLFLAAGIFDRYIAMIGPSNFPRDQAMTLATISMLLAAKVEEPVQPSFNRMIKLLSEWERTHVCIKSLIDLEEKVLTTLGFDFNFPGPI